MLQLWAAGSLCQIFFVLLLKHIHFRDFIAFLSQVVRLAQGAVLNTFALVEPNSMAAAFQVEPMACITSLVGINVCFTISVLFLQVSPQVIRMVGGDGGFQGVEVCPFSVGVTGGSLTSMVPFQSITIALLLFSFAR